MLCASAAVFAPLFELGGASNEKRLARGTVLSLAPFARQPGRLQRFRFCGRHIRHSRTGRHVPSGEASATVTLDRSGTHLSPGYSHRQRLPQRPTALGLFTHVVRFPVPLTFVVCRTNRRDQSIGSCHRPTHVERAAKMSPALLSIARLIWCDFRPRCQTKCRSCRSPANTINETCVRQKSRNAQLIANVQISTVAQ